MSFLCQKYPEVYNCIPPPAAPPEVDLHQYGAGSIWCRLTPVVKITTAIWLYHPYRSLPQVAYPLLPLLPTATFLALLFLTQPLIIIRLLSNISPTRRHLLYFPHPFSITSPTLQHFSHPLASLPQALPFV